MIGGHLGKSWQAISGEMRARITPLRSPGAQWKCQPSMKNCVSFLLSVWLLKRTPGTCLFCQFRWSQKHAACRTPFTWSSRVSWWTTVCAGRWLAANTSVRGGHPPNANTPPRTCMGLANHDHAAIGKAKQPSSGTCYARPQAITVPGTLHGPMRTVGAGGGADRGDQGPLSIPITQPRIYL